MNLVGIDNDHAIELESLDGVGAEDGCFVGVQLLSELDSRQIDACERSTNGHAQPG
ncbi:MAG: hypothetical protein GKR86_00790 [Ilumatobacter sp.]|nr:hypothetical protein [Ilumatobacter sp.]